MKNFKLKFLTAIFVLALLGAAPVSASHYWKLDFATPSTLTNDPTFNLEFTTLSTVASDDITVEAFQNGTSIGSTVTTADYGDSGAFSVDLSSQTDGTYNFMLKATNSNGGETRSSVVKSVTLDTKAPSAPDYEGKSQVNNDFEIGFNVANDDTTRVRIYSSTSTTFTADNSTLVGVVDVSPGESRTFSYSTLTSQDRYHAIQALDAAGNSSELVGDPNIVVTQTPASNTGGGDVTTGDTGGVDDGDGEVAGATTINEDANGATQDEADEDAVIAENGDVLGAETRTDDDSSLSTVQRMALILGLPLVLIALYKNRNRLTDYWNNIRK